MKFQVLFSRPLLVHSLKTNEVGLKLFSDNELGPFICVMLATALHKSMTESLEYHQGWLCYEILISSLPAQSGRPAIDDNHQLFSCAKYCLLARRNPYTQGDHNTVGTEY